MDATKGFQKYQSNCNDLEILPCMLVRNLLKINIYHHYSSLFLRKDNWKPSFMHSRESVIQGDPIYIIAYAIGILPLTKNLKKVFYDITQTGTMTMPV